MQITQYRNELEAARATIDSQHSTYYNLIMSMHKEEQRNRESQASLQGVVSCQSLGGAETRARPGRDALGQSTEYHVNRQTGVIYPNHSEVSLRIK